MSATAGEVSGVVNDAEGNPVEGAVVVVKRQSDNATFETTTGVSGGFQFTGLSSGTYHVMARHEDTDGNLFNALSKPYVTVN
jgi:hypothetical protein